MKIFVSDCCGASPKGNADCDTRDVGICPSCGEHCEYEVQYDEEGKKSIKQNPMKKNVPKI